MRIYISGPVTGREDYVERFTRAEMEIQEKFGENAQIINPVQVCAALPDMEYEEYMKLCLCLLDMSEAIYMLDGWQQSAGANREFGYALAKNMVIIKEHV